jgi:hypothetical protein
MKKLRDLQNKKILFKYGCIVKFKIAIGFINFHLQKAATILVDSMVENLKYLKVLSEAKSALVKMRRVSNFF